MKVLGLNFGRVKGNCKHLLNIAMESAKKAYPDAEYEVVDAIKLKIKECIGCGACSRVLQSGKGQIYCCQKDDYEALSDKVLAADCIIVVAPVYVLAPGGKLKNFVDRFGPAHDKAFMLFENELRKDNGGDELNPDCFKKHLVSYISVGGATSDHWVSYGLPGMNLFGMSLNMKVVDQVDAYGCYHPDMMKNNEAECERLGKRIVENYGKKYSEITWESEPGTCPVCHCNQVILNGTSKVCCPVCGIYGTVKMDGDQLTVEFPEEEQNRSRLKLSGVIEHQVEIGRRDRYPKFDEYVAKFRAMQDEM